MEATSQPHSSTEPTNEHAYAQTYSSPDTSMERQGNPRNSSQRELASSPPLSALNTNQHHNSDNTEQDTVDSDSGITGRQMQNISS